jgi:hypothetical protein
LPKIGIEAYLEKIKPVLQEKVKSENKAGLKISVLFQCRGKKKSINQSLKYFKCNFH